MLIILPPTRVNLISAQVSKLIKNGQKQWRLKFKLLRILKQKRSQNIAELNKGCYFELRKQTIEIYRCRVICLVMRMDTFRRQLKRAYQSSQSANSHTRRQTHIRSYTYICTYMCKDVHTLTLVRTDENMCTPTGTQTQRREATYTCI